MGKSDGTPASGVYAAILTPRAAQSTEADTSGFFDYLDKVSQAGVDGIVLFGSTGEFVHYDLEDRMRVVSLAVKRSRLPALVNVSHSSLQGSVDLAQQAETAGAAGLLLMPPYFYHYEDGEIEQFYRDFLRQADPRLPTYLYNLSPFTTPLSPDMLNRLLSSGRFAGVKDSSGSWEVFTSILRLKQTISFQALIGNESLLFEALRKGADGIISGIAAAVPELVVGAREAFLAGNTGQQNQFANQLTEFMAWVAKFPASVAIKVAADFRGWLPCQLAVPLGPAACERLVEFRSWLSTWLPGVRT